MLDCDCPRCGSKNTKALSVLYESGTRTSTYRKDGLFYYRGSVGLHASTTRGQSQTLSAQHAAPPQPLGLSAGAVTVFLFIGLLLGGTTGFWIAVSVLVAFAIFIGIGSGTAQREAYAEWSSTFRCGRCGTVFAVIEAADPAGLSTDGSTRLEGPA